MSVIGVSQVQGRVPVTVFHINDRINMGNTTELEAAARLAYQQGARSLLIDLTHAPSITSAGLRSILVIYRLLENDPSGQDPSVPRKSSHLKLLNPSLEVRRTLQISGFESYFEIYTDLEKAIASFGD